jgi:hypothetical protein
MATPRFDPEGDDALEELRTRGEAVFEKSWIGGTPDDEPGGSREVLYRLDGKYWYASEIDGLVEPFASLHDALEACDDLVAVTEATTEVWCSELSPVEITRYLRDYTLDQSVDFDINDETWRLEDGRWVRVLDSSFGSSPDTPPPSPAAPRARSASSRSRRSRRRGSARGRPPSPGR